MQRRCLLLLLGLALPPRPAEGLPAALHGAPPPAVGRASAGLLEFAARARHAAARRPIITGCLEECGYNRQACVTECEVCVERSRCKALATCSACLNETRTQKLEYEKAEGLWYGVPVDSGGASLRHDNIRQQLRSAELHLADVDRQARTARNDVLAAQREVEFGAEERSARGRELNASKARLREAKERQQKWDRLHEKEISHENLKELKLAERRLAQTEADLEDAQEDLRKRQSQLQKVGGSNETAVRLVQQAEDHEWDLRRKVDELKQKVESLRKRLRQRKDDASWVSRELSEEVQQARLRVRRIEEKLHDGEMLWRVTRQHLRNAQDEQLKANAAQAAAEKSADDLEESLEKHPMASRYRPTREPWMAEGGCSGWRPSLALLAATLAAFLL